ncbi:DUF6025 family protein [Acaricomes phytoseiuli]|uniref:DUF6025 family protein n=1 Tax=Acaricomes phytoseiuli TaxID=291968 RepID=UPI0003615873|nr:DUF6025 family protein [Acaricomes phytoseiuli]MCW1249353.1 DUF6025 family protein [Acaricomes phytoseiuli]
MRTLDRILEKDLAGASARESAELRLSHLGLSNYTVSDVFAAVSTAPSRAVRSGHIGNWETIWAGQAGLLDYNRYICRDLRLGTPVVHAHTFTETLAMDDGDTIYLPAGQVHQKRYRRLPVFIKRGQRFIETSPDESICAAFAYVETGTGIAPLIQSRAEELEMFDEATTIPTILCDDPELLHRALTALVDKALNSPGELSLKQVFGSSVSYQGKRGAAPEVMGSEFIVSGTRYGSIGDLVEATISGLRFGALDHPETHSVPHPEDHYLPLLGATALLCLFAYIDCFQTKSPIHTHWGAVSMAGCPPISGGYFSRRANRRTLRQISNALAGLEEISASPHFTLLPAPILSLLPPAEFDVDCALADSLMNSVRDSTGASAPDAQVATEEIRSIVQKWLNEHSGDLDPYYVDRFRMTRSVFSGAADGPVDGTPHSPAALGSLTMRQASLLLGVLMEESKGLSESRPPRQRHGSAQHSAPRSSSW